jgi:uncharacterized protein (DUF1697 family)
LVNANDELRASTAQINAQIETALPGAFNRDSELIETLVLTRKQLEVIVDYKPDGFGEHPEKFHSDAVFLIGIHSAEAMRVFDPREGVDRVWPGDGVIYSQRLSALRTKSRLSEIVGTLAYKSMTIRSWTTTTTLLEMLRKAEAELVGSRPTRVER